MPDTSPELTSQKSKGGFDEIHEVVRVFTLYDDTRNVKVRVNIWRYYNKTGESYAAYYEREDEDGEWKSADYGKVLTGSESEESAIRNAVGFVRQAHSNHRSD